MARLEAPKNLLESTPAHVTSMSWLFINQDENGKEVILKIPNPTHEFENKQAVLDAFYNEVKTLRRIGKHRSISTLLGILTDGQIGFFLEYLDPKIWKNGVDIVRENRIYNHLAAKLDTTDRRPDFNLFDLAYITVQAIEVLKYAIRHNILHRDLKPGNMFYRQGHLVIVDWALAGPPKANRGPHSTTSYLSIQSSVESNPVTIADELHALVISLFEFLTGCVPFSSDTETRTIDERQTVDIRKAPDTAEKKIRRLEVYSGLYDFEELRKCKFLNDDQKHKVREFFQRVIVARDYTEVEDLDIFVRDFFGAIGIQKPAKHFKLQRPFPNYFYPNFLMPQRAVAQRLLHVRRS